MGYLRGLADEFGESSNAIRVELNRFESAGLLISMIDGNKKIYQANSSHPLFPEIQSLVFKYMGIDKLRENVTNNYKNIEEVWITGNYNFMNDNDNANLLLVGEGFDRIDLNNLLSNIKNTIHREINVITVLPKEIGGYLSLNKSSLLIWKASKLKTSTI
jgi:hypothetical protein